MTLGPRHRRLLLLRGSAAQTQAEARARLSAFTPDSVLWISADTSPEGFERAEGRAVAGLLGRSFDALVLDGHGGLDPELLGQAHGLVRGGGAFLLRLDPVGVAQSERFCARFAAEGYSAAEVGERWPARVEAALSRARPWTQAGPLTPPDGACGPSPEVLAEQSALVERLVARWRGQRPSFTALLADRGRGKSSALGLALAAFTGGDGRELSPRETEHAQIIVTAASRDAVREVEHFAGQRAPRFVPFAELLRELRAGEGSSEGPRPPLVIVDEAARLPTSSLEALVRGCPRAHFVFATTTHGYEGTGRGFALRFLAWLEQHAGNLARETLATPIRWGAGDGLEAFVFDLLLLDAEPATLGADALAAAEDMRIEAVELERDALAADERRLRELFGLLVQAHYRTTPSDLLRLLDAPNLRVHALLLAGQVIAATLVAREGSLAAQTCADMARGRRRIRAHALADSLVSHLSRVDAGALTMVRSVRIAVHPQLRRRGLATRLVEHIHRRYEVDLFGTLFGATPQILRFRRSLGYVPVRLSASRGARSGEPAVVMVRPCSARAHRLVAELRARFAWDLPLRLELLAEGAPASAKLCRELSRDLPEPAALDLDACRAELQFYAHGPRTYASVAQALSRLVSSSAGALAALPALERELIERRVCAGQKWEDVCCAMGLGTVPATMRALRRAVRAFLAHADAAQ